jgi:AraC family ethanolamine operon transcriptional activator
MNNSLFNPQVLIYDELKDLEFINALSQGWDNRWTYIKRGGTEAKLWVFTTPRMQFSWVGYDNAIMIESSPPEGSVQISFVRTSGVCSSLNQKVEKHELIIIYSGEETNYLANEANEIFSLVFEKHFFDQIFYRYFGKALDDIRNDYRLNIEENGVDNFILHMQYWLAFFQKGESQKLSRDIYLHIEEDIVDHLFGLIHVKEKKSTREQFDISYARQVLESNIDNIYSIGDLVNELHVSTRTLQSHFKAKLGISPKQYLQNLRLNTIREELLRADPHNTTVSEIALKYGFFHPSHFTLEYKKLFNKTPTQTLSKTQ